MTKPRKILVTSALPYANGSIHLGHLVEYIQTDIWVRFQKLCQNEIIYVCADDAHGTPIMLKAEKEGVSPKELVEQTHKEHSKDFSDFLINFDNFYSTHSPENQKRSSDIYLKLKENGYISKKTITQAFDNEKSIFLPDRFVKGTCPKCKTPDQYGDNCEACGATYSPTDLIDPVSAISGKTPIEKESEHYFFELAKLQDFLKTWLNESKIQPEIRNKMQEWLDTGLMSWDISRDAPYWGFKIPETENKYFYVWLDAPIGYMASFENYCNQNGIDFNQYWQKDSTTELYHFIGKDIAYFHTLFWPATLYGSGYRTPNGIFCHGFLTINGAKMSKSRGTFIKASTYLKHLKPEYLRYYYASKLSNSIEDIDLNLEDFKQKNNSDLVGKLVNLASRCAGFINKKFDNTLSVELDHPELFSQAAEKITNEVIVAYENREYAQAMRTIMSIADKANEYIDTQKPWVLIKDQSQLTKVQAICTTGLNLFYQLMIALTPVLPELSKSAWQFLNLKEEPNFKKISTAILAHKIHSFSPLLTRIEDQSLQAMLEDSKNIDPTPKANPLEIKPNQSIINIDDFNQIDLRVAKVIDCNTVKGADKLLQFKLDVGPLGERQVFSGIKNSYPDPKQLIGKNLILVSNLAPRKMRFGLSEGMLLSSGNDDHIALIQASETANPGDLVK